MGSTLTRYEGANYWRPEGEAARERFNAFVRDSRSGCDGVIDQDTATHDPAKPSWFLPAYDSGASDAGHKAIGNAVDLAWFFPKAERVRPHADETGNSHIGAAWLGM